MKICTCESSPSLGCCLILHASAKHISCPFIWNFFWGGGVLPVGDVIKTAHTSNEGNCNGMLSSSYCLLCCHLPWLWSCMEKLLITLWQAFPTTGYVLHCFSQYIAGLFCICKCVGDLLCKGNT